jgi:hypothetical protein
VPDPIVPPSNGDGSTGSEEPKRSLRETLENAWDKLEENTPDEPGDGESPEPAPQPTVDSQGRLRDEHGRWVRRDEIQPGEAAQRPQQAEHPAPQEAPQQPQAAAPSPGQPGVAAQAPANWDAEARAAFEEQTPAGKEFLLRRHSEMESFVQQRVQANAQAANFAQSLAPVFNDPVIAGSLQQAGVGAAEAIQQWAVFHRRFMTDPLPMIAELIQRAGVDPAVFAQMSPAGQQPQPGGAQPLTPEQLKDPALRFIADHIGRQHSDIVGLRTELQAMRSAGEQRQAQEVMRVTRWGIDSFAEEKDPQGNPLHPHFDAVLPHIITLFKADPRRDLHEAYEQALWMDANTRGTLLQRERASVQQQQADQRARQQVRSNITGRTHPAVPMPRGDQATGKRSLRDVLEDAADKVGIE